jgi:hypothetical protein
MSEGHPENLDQSCKPLRQHGRGIKTAEARLPEFDAGAGYRFVGALRLPASSRVLEEAAR